MARGLRGVLSHPAFHCVLLALPFLIGIVLLNGLTTTLPVHQGSDENLHYAASLAFAQQLPFVDLHRGYNTSSGPLFYYVFGAAARLFGAALWKLRLLNVLISYATCVALYLMLRRTLETPPLASLSLAFVVAASPYLLGQTFILLTDNLMYLWIVIALDALMRYVRRPSYAPLVAASVSIALALLTRQFAVWLVVLAAIAVWRGWTDPGRRLAGLAIVAASCVPIGLVMLAWGGVIQPGSTFMLASHSSRVPWVAQALAVLGLYVLTVVPLARLRSLGSAMLRTPWLWLVGLGAVLLLEIDHIAQQPLRFGVLSISAAGYPDIAGTSILYFVLAPAGAIFLAWALRAYADDVRKSLVLIGLVLVCLTTLASAVYYQRYVDVPILLLVAMLASGRERLHWLDFVRWWLLIGAFVAAIFAFVQLLPSPRSLKVDTHLPE